MTCDLCGYEADPLPIPHFRAGRWCDGKLGYLPQPARGSVGDDRSAASPTTAESGAQAPTARPRLYVYGRLVTDDDVRTALRSAGDDYLIAFESGALPVDEAYRIASRRMRQSIELRSKFR